MSTTLIQLSPIFKGMKLKVKTIWVETFHNAHEIIEMSGLEQHLKNCPINSWAPIYSPAPVQHTSGSFQENPTRIDLRNHSSSALPLLPISAHSAAWTSSVEKKCSLISAGISRCQLCFWVPAHDEHRYEECFISFGRWAVPGGTVG